MTKIVLSGRNKVAKSERRLVCSSLYHVLSNLSFSGVGVYNMMVVYSI